MTIKHDKMETHCDWLPPRNSHKPLNMCSQEVTWQTKNISIITLLMRYQQIHITQGILTHKVTWSLNKVVMWGHVTNYIHYISTCRRPINTKLGKVLTYSKRLPYLKSHDKGLFLRKRGKRQKRTKYLKIWAKMYKIRKYFEKEQPHAWDYRTHETARICPAWLFDYVTNVRSRGSFENCPLSKELRPVNLAAC